MRGGAVIQLHQSPVGIPLVAWNLLQLDAAAVGVEQQRPVAVTDGQPRAPVDGVTGDRETPLPEPQLLSLVPAAEQRLRDLLANYGSSEFASLAEFALLPPAAQ